MPDAFALKIKTANAAFRDADAEDCDPDNLKREIEAAHNDAAALEVARILREIAKKLETGTYCGAVVDANGNNVGRFDLG